MFPLQIVENNSSCLSHLRDANADFVQLSAVTDHRWGAVKGMIGYRARRTNFHQSFCCFRHCSVNVSLEVRQRMALFQQLFFFNSSDIENKCLAEDICHDLDFIDNEILGDLMTVKVCWKPFYIVLCVVCN